MNDRDNITLPREVVEKAIKAFENGCPPTCENGMIDSGGFSPWGEPILEPCPACLAFEHLRTALDAPSEDIEALRRDAERYRWMKREVKRIPPAWDLVGWDAAIDAAMQEDKP